MCGIVGYAGREQAAPILLDGLQRLEYRGYDSAGAAVCDGGMIQVRKAAGRLERLAQLLESHPAVGVTGIGHTRWATHGPPADHNAHPHVDCTGRVAVVHNGIIENYLALREELVARGHRFSSDTDTEVLPHLIEENYRGDLLEAVRRSLARLKGSWAIAVVHADEPGRLIVARKDSPLVVGAGAGANYAASDIPAILPYTRSVYVLEDDELAVITADGITFFDIEGRPQEKDVLHVEWDAAASEKGGYEHFMLKEIHEQPRAVRDTLAGKLDRERRRIVLPGVSLAPAYVRALRKIDVLAMGTARHAGLVGKPVLERFARIPVEVDLAAEFRYRDPLVDQGTMALIISQSGET
ncbi:MAG: glutamine--fructose-6-phosphate transaminase (isomerizing), partial [Firmicutes bacterium ZCTH02-B6]